MTMTPTGLRTLVDRVRVSGAWPLWLPAAVALVTGLAVFLGGALAGGGWMLSPLFLEFLIPYAVLFLVDLALAASASRAGGLKERQALIGITVSTAVAAVVLILIAVEVVEAVVLLAALVPAWAATRH